MSDHNNAASTPSVTWIGMQAILRALLDDFISVAAKSAADEALMWNGGLLHGTMDYVRAAGMFSDAVSEFSGGDDTACLWTLREIQGQQLGHCRLKAIVDAATRLVEMHSIHTACAMRKG